MIKATQPFERLSMDFKGPFKSSSKNTYLLVIVDEYSRFPFVYPCADMKSSTIIEKLYDLFSVFCFPAYIHTDQGTSFMSKELKEWHHGKGIPTSWSTRYNQRGNSQIERYNKVVWKAFLGL